MICHCPLWLTQIFWVALMACVIGTIPLYVMKEEARAQLQFTYNTLSIEMAENMESAAQAIIVAVQNAADVVTTFEPRLGVCGPAVRNHTGETLLRALTALPDPSGDTETWLSLGLMQRASDDLTPPAAATAKWSWQMALGFGCPEYIYAYIDAATAPAFVGYCANLTPGGFNLSSTIAYNGTDWGFTPVEREMLFEAKYTEAFVPVKALLGVLEFSYRRLVSCNGKPYALIFASRSIAHLDKALAAHREENLGVSFIIERTTGLLVASSIANQTHAAGTDVRVGAVNATNALIRSAMAYLPAANGVYANSTRYANIDDTIYVTVTPYAPVRGIDWLLVTAVAADDIASILQEGTKKADIISAVIIVVLVLVTIAGTIFFFTLPVRRMLARARGERTSCCFSFSDISALDEALLRTGSESSTKETVAHST